MNANMRVPLTPMHRRRLRALLGAFAAGLIVLLGRAFQVQVLEHGRWAAIAAEQQRQRVALPARRGAIRDRAGRPLALTRESYRLAVAPREVRDRTGLAAALRRELGLPPAWVARAVDRRRAWVVLPGRYEPEQWRRLRRWRGVHGERVLERFYPYGELARSLLGGVDADGRARGGLEQEFDSLLAGRPGEAIVRRGPDGRPRGTVPVRPPQDGADLWVSLDLRLQDVVEAALDRALASTGAQGGDILVVDPRTGDLLAAASRRPGGRAWAAAVEPVEPGSTLKPFIFAALLARGRLRAHETLEGENRQRAWAGRTVRDVHPYARLSTLDVLRVSSNVGTIKLALRLRPEELYIALRAFGFGTPTGIDYPIEAAGRLPLPARWTSWTRASVPIGYEISATPLQLVYAYAALARDGILLEPRLVLAAREAGGHWRWERPVQPVRQAVPPTVARTLTGWLEEVVRGGTATEATLATLRVAGKTGTARRVRAGGYRGGYTASFVGYLPAEAPRAVVLVKLDDPRTAIYGGAVAAPVFREVVQALLAEGAPLRPPAAVPPTRAALAPADAPGPYVFAVAPVASPRTQQRDRSTRVPDVVGLPLHQAVHRLLRAGLRPQIHGVWRAIRIDPPAGTPLAPGAVVHLFGEGPADAGLP
jgi:cell division protein FtsI (penicillin-binding protein 3)